MSFFETSFILFFELEYNNCSWTQIDGDKDLLKMMVELVVQQVFKELIFIDELKVGNLIMEHLIASVIVS